MGFFVPFLIFLLANNFSSPSGDFYVSPKKEINLAKKEEQEIKIPAASVAESVGKKQASNKNIVSLLFGEEYQGNANDRQKKLAHLAIDSGAKIVVGHHPHVVQEVEQYKNGVIAYSLGNFIFDQNFSKETMQGLALEIVLDGAEIISVKQNKIKINEFFQPQLAD